MRIEKQVFDQPSGTVRGSAQLFMDIGKKKDHRVCHAFFLVGKPTEVSVTIPGKQSPADLLRIADALKEFSEAVKDN